MDFNRFFLYTSLAIVTYFLLLAWQQDYPPVVDDGSSTSSETIADVPLIPQSFDASPATDVPSDLPTQNTPAAQDTPTIVGQPTSNPADIRSVAVSTDTFKLQIDLDGGDIVNLSLPKFLKELDVASDPFIMLDTMPNRAYVPPSRPEVPWIRALF